MALRDEGHACAGPLARLRVGVDVRADGLRRTGVGRYGAVLLETLRDFGAAAEIVTDGDGGLSRARRWPRAVSTAARRLERRGDAWLRPDLFGEAHVHFTLHRRLMTLVCDDPPDIMHWTYPLPLRLEGARNVYAVHDLIPLETPELTGIPLRRHERMLAAIVETADAMVTVSDTSRAAIDRRLGGTSLPVVTTFQSAGRPEPSASLPAGLDHDGFLLFCGSVEPRKNLIRLVAAYARSGVALPLVLAGPPGWRAEHALPASLPPGVLRLSWAPRPDLMALIAHARALVFPSLAEGFGLPMLEAFTLGTPVLTSKGGALAEIAGAAALLVDPTDETDIAAGLARIVADRGLRSSLRRRAAARASDFASAAYAVRLKDAYRAAGAWTGAG